MIFTGKKILLGSILLLIIGLASCKKDNSVTTSHNAAIATPTKLGLYEADSSIYRQLDIVITKVGTQSTNYGLIFDTGSGGMVLDANGIIPASMITASGFNIPGDSTVVNGITITSQTTMIEYGADNNTTNKVYGNLAYAPVTIGDQNGNIVIKRLPFFLYYKAVDNNNHKLDPHFFDTFGVSQEYITFNNNSYITSPFSYYDPGNGLTRGFKLAALGTTNFSLAGTYVPGVITIGLTPNDLSGSSGFVTTPVQFYQGAGYVPEINSTITYNGKVTNTPILFDTGTSGYSFVEDQSAKDTIITLPLNSKVKLATNSGFNYTYTNDGNSNSTYIENPTLSGAGTSIMSIDFFLNNEYLLDFTNHKLGLKNN